MKKIMKVIGIIILIINTCCFYLLHILVSQHTLV